MKDVSFEKIAAEDLARHLDARLKTVLQDFMDRAAECDLTYDAATALAVTVLGHYYTIAAAHGLEASETELLSVCRWQYRQAQKLSVRE